MLAKTMDENRKYLTKIMSVIFPESNARENYKGNGNSVRLWGDNPDNRVELWFSSKGAVLYVGRNTPIFDAVMETLEEFKHESTSGKKSHKEERFNFPTLMAATDKLNEIGVAMKKATKKTVAKKEAKGEKTA